MKKIEKYGLIITRDNKFLIGRKKGTKLFILPGGKPELKETAEECLEREIKEEHDCEIKKSSLKFLGVFEDSAANEQDTIISVKLYLGDIIGEPRCCSEIEEIRWFGKEDDKSILSPVLKNEILPELVRRVII